MVAKRVVSFKPTAECEVQLAELMGRWGCDRTAAIVRAVSVAYLKRVPPGLDPSIASLPKDPKAVVAEILGPPSLAIPGKPLTAPDIVTGTHTTVEPTKGTRSQQERMDDFYRANMAKGKK